MSTNTTTKKTSMVTREIPVQSIVFANYQRPVNKKRVDAIVDTFNPNRMHPIDVSYRDGKYWCFDGQHRTAVYKQLRFPTIPAVVHFGLSYEDEAQLFAEQSVNVGTVNNVSKWRGFLEAKDKESVSINDICQKFGYTVAAKRAKQQNTNIHCISALQKVYRTIGASGLECVLSLINDAWYGKPDSIRIDVIDGLALIRKIYDNDPSKPSRIDWKRMRKILKANSPTSLIFDAGMYRIGKYDWGSNRGVPFARHLIDVYNKNLSMSSPSRVPNEIYL